MCYFQAARRPPRWMPHGCLLRCVEAIPCLSAVSRSTPPGRRGDPLFVGSVTVGSFREARRPHRIDVGAAVGEPHGARAAYGLVVQRLAMLVHLLMSVQGATSVISSPGAGPDGRAAAPNWERNRHSSSSSILYAIKQEA